METDEIPVGRAENLKGQKFGKLTVLYRVKPQNKSHTTFWKCQCDCGNITIVGKNHLIEGGTKSCGCLHASIKNKTTKQKNNNKSIKQKGVQRIDETGNKYGLLTVIEYAGNNEQNKALWKCKCDCGKEIIVLGKFLRNGKKTHCGCCKNVKLIPLGTKINHLTVLERQGSINGRATYKCQCDCGNIIIVDSHRLNQKTIRSCGCFTMSKGEEKIKQLLDDYNIHYITQHGFKDCVGLKNWKLRFDFYVNNNYYIEYDGRQHFQPVEAWGKDSFNTTQCNDQIKNKYCKTHNIPLIRIPYWHYDDITIEDLKPETSQFLI